MTANEIMQSMEESRPGTKSPLLKACSNSAPIPEDVCQSRIPNTPEHSSPRGGGATASSSSDTGHSSQHRKEVPHHVRDEWPTPRRDESSLGLWMPLDAVRHLRNVELVKHHWPRAMALMTCAYNQRSTSDKSGAQTTIAQGRSRAFRASAMTQ